MAAVQNYTPPDTKIVHITQADFGTRPSIFMPVHLVQYDKKLPVVQVDLYNNGTKYAIPAGAEANIRVGKRGAKFVSNPVLGCSSDRMSLFFEGTQQMVTDPGKIPAVIELIVSDDIAYSGPINLLVDRNPVQEGDIESTTEYKSVKDYADAAYQSAAEADISQQLAKQWENMAETARNDAMDAQESAETARDQAKASQTAAATSASQASASQTAAKASQDAAATSATNAKTSEDAAKTAQTAAETARKGAETAQSAAATSQAEAKKSQDAAAASQEAAKASETNAAQARTGAETAQTGAQAAQKAAETARDQASASQTAAKASQDAAATSAANAKNSEGVASGYATEAESWAHGDTGTRIGEDTDNARYWYEQTLHLSQGFEGLVYMGTVAFADLKTASKVVNHMYNISDGFTSDSTFNTPGVVYGPGNNVVWTNEGKWDVMAGSTVVGVYGNAEPSARQGAVAIAPSNLKLESTYATVAARALPAVNDLLPAAIGKLAKYAADLKTVAFSGKIGDLTGINDLSAKTSVANTDNLIVGSKDAPFKITYPNLLNAMLTNGNVVRFLNKNPFDFNDPTIEAGMYRLSIDLLNAPGDVSYGNVLVVRNNYNDTLAMLVFPYMQVNGECIFYYRSGNRSTFPTNPWTRVPREKYTASTGLELVGNDVRLASTAIPSNANLNNYKTPGFYRCSVNSTAATLSNCPVQYAFVLEVLNVNGTDTSNGAVVQRLTQYTPTDPNTFVRGQYGATWGEWVKIYDTHNLPKFQDQIDTLNTRTSGLNDLTQKIQTSLNSLINRLNFIDEEDWTPTLYDYNTFKKTLTPGKYSRIGRLGIAFVEEIGTLDNITISTLLEIRGIPFNPYGATGYLRAYTNPNNSSNSTSNHWQGLHYGGSNYAICLRGSWNDTNPIGSFGTNTLLQLIIFGTF